MNKLRPQIVNLTKETIKLSITAFILLGVSFYAMANEDTLKEVLSQQSDKHKARYDARHPQKTLEFFGIEPGMTVAESLPGGGWYSKILLPLLGENGKLIGIGYALDMYPEFRFYSEKKLRARQAWAKSLTTKMNGWAKAQKAYAGKTAAISVTNFGSVPKELYGTADAVLFVRALHNLNRFERNGGYLTIALKETYAMLKPGGIVGVVQHQAPDHMPNSWADGSKGYLKKDRLIKKFERVGFEFVAQSPINENAKDQPTEKDIVWRLPPSLSGNKTDKEKAKYIEIGESNRMTLKFRKSI